MEKPSTLEKCILIIAGVYKKPSSIPDRVRWNIIPLLSSEVSLQSVVSSRLLFYGKCYVILTDLICLVRVSIILLLLCCCVYLNVKQFRAENKRRYVHISSLYNREMFTPCFLWYLVACVYAVTVRNACSCVLANSNESDLIISVMCMYGSAAPM